MSIILLDLVNSKRKNNSIHLVLTGLYLKQGHRKADVQKQYRISHFAIRTAHV